MLIGRVCAKIDKRMSILKEKDDFMKELEPVFCPIHGKKLLIERETIQIDGKYTSLVVGKCPECQIRYIGKRKRVTKTGKKGSFIYDGKIYEYTPRMQQIELSINKGELPVKCPEPERLIKRTEETSESLKNKGTDKTELKLPRQIYVASNLDLKKCPVCDKKTTFTPKKLLLKNGNQTSIMGYECFKCHAPFILEKIAEEYLLNDYIDNLNLDYLKVDSQKSSRESLTESVPIYDLKEIKICVLQRHSPKCRVHGCELEIRQVVLKDEKTLKELPVSGGYCDRCQRLYITDKMKNRMLDKFQVDGEIPNIPNILKMKVTGKKWKNVMPISVVKIELGIGGKEEIIIKENWKQTHLDENNMINPTEIRLIENSTKGNRKAVKKELPEEKNFKTEIAVISATYNKEEVLIHVVKRLEKGENTAGKADEICVRSLSLLGRELLGRIAHKELVEFSTEKETVKIHQFKVWPDEEYNLYGFKKFTDVDKVQTITILNQKNLPSGSDDYETVTALVYCAGRDLPVYIDIYYSKLNDEYFINSDSYELYTRRYGLPYVRIISDEYGGNFGYDDLRQQSELSLYGYSVGKNAGLTSADRQRLLQQLLDNHFMTKSQIINHLEWLINTHKYRESMRDACDCWKEDLMYVHQCKINTQRAVWGKFAYKGTVLK